MSIRKDCQWPTGRFSVRDMPGDHEPTYLVLPDGALISISYHGDPKVNPAQCRFIADACNAALDNEDWARGSALIAPPEQLQCPDCGSWADHDPNCEQIGGQP